MIDVPDDLPLEMVLALAPIALEVDPQTWCCVAVELMPLALTLFREWCLLDNPGETADQALTFAHFAGR
jgi:hypothetical protein